MIIVCTHDPTIISWARNRESGATAWHATAILPAGASRRDATTTLANTLGALNFNTNEPLCLDAHGNDTEIGDAENGPNDWVWSIQQLARLLQDNAPNYRGPILIKACAKHVVNFSAGLAVELGKRGALRGVTIYGYNTAISCKQSFPDPGKLDKQVDLQGTIVG